MRTVISMLLILLSTPSFAKTRLMLFGGHGRPDGAMRIFANWANYDRVLVIAWPGEEEGKPLEYFDGISAQLKKFGVKETIPSFKVPESDMEWSQFFQTLSSVSGVFITGGVQDFAMDQIRKYLPDPNPLFNALIKKFQEGIPFAGTSAGTAIMSQVMINPSEVGYGSGLGIVKDITFDMHFFKRNRDLKKRLQIAMQATGVPMGIGIDEDSALSLEDLHHATVLGPTDVMVYHSAPEGIQSDRLSYGEHYDLKTKKRMNCSLLLQTKS